MKKYLAYLLSVLAATLVLTGAGCTSAEDTTNINSEATEVSDVEVDADDAMAIEKAEMVDAMEEDEMMMEVDDVMISALREPDYTHKGKLVAVADDAATGPENGLVWSVYNADEEMYTLYATFDGLPVVDAEEFFYEGWIVRKGDNMSVVSTGAVEYDADLKQWVNRYQTATDLSDHDFYVLTLEPNDDDSAPADHILEGTLEEL